MNKNDLIDIGYVIWMWLLIIVFIGIPLVMGILKLIALIKYIFS